MDLVAAKQMSGKGLGIARFAATLCFAISTILLVFSLVNAGPVTAPTDQRVPALNFLQPFAAG